MLSIYGIDCYTQEEREDIIAFPSDVFDEYCKDEWLNDIFVRKMITDIDKHDVMNTSMPTRTLLALDDCIPSILSTGVKNLVLCKFLSGYKNRLGMMGENCYKWLMKIADTKDVAMTTTRYFGFPDELFVNGRCIYFPDLDVYATTGWESMLAFGKLKESGLFGED